MGQSDWDQRYASGEAPWDVGETDEHLAGFIEAGRAQAGRALEVGCGTGTNALWLAGRGFQVVGVDLSGLAVERAKAKAKDSKACEFHRLDFLLDDVPRAPFDFAFDRGCFHVFDEAADRARFAERIAALLAPEGLWLSLIGSTEGVERLEGPPRRSARDVAMAIEPALELVELRQVSFTSNRPTPALAWLSLARRRAVPAQPSTRRP
jgi:SAM-dependent methyltransferase